MAVEWKQRMKIIDQARIGEKIVSWAMGEELLPKSYKDFCAAMDPGFIIVDENGAQRTDGIDIVADPEIDNEDNKSEFVNIRKIRFVRTERDTIVIKLPPQYMIGKSRERYTATNPPFPIEDYPFRNYERVDVAQLQEDGVTAEEMFYSEVGDYTTSECA